MRPKLPKNWILNKIMSEKKIYGTGRRKNSIARVFMEPGKGDIKVRFYDTLIGQTVYYNSAKSLKELKLVLDNA